MSYTPTEWSTGDTITAALLNKMENGIAAGGSGYDAEILCYCPSGSSAAYEYTIVSGSYASITALMADDTAPRILLRIVNENVPSFWATTDTVTVWYWSTEVSVPYFQISALWFNPEVVSPTDLPLYWNANDEVYD